MINVYVCYTVYHLLCAISLIVKDKDETAKIYLADDIPEVNEFKNRLSDENIDSEVIKNISIKNKLKDENFFKKISTILSFKKRLFNIYSSYPINTDSTYHLFHVGTVFSKYIFYNKPQIVVFEDGYSRFAHLRQKKSQNLIEFLNLMPKVNAKNITAIKGINSKGLKGKILNKFEYFDFHNTLFNLSEDDIKLVTKVLAPDIISISKTKNMGIILTQPLFQDHLVKSQKKQIEIYKEIYNRIKNNHEDILIKPHPRDEQDYNNFNLKLIKKEIPFELLRMNNINFDKYYTIHSTALSNISNDKIVYFDDLLE